MNKEVPKAEGLIGWLYENENCEVYGGEPPVGQDYRLLDHGTAKKKGTPILVYIKSVEIKDIILGQVPN